MKRQIETVFPRPTQPGMVGDGFTVYNFIPGTAGIRRRTTPFLMLDFNALQQLPPSDYVKGVGAHPHKGFETVTIAYQGSVAHHDSAGNRGVIHAGDVQWMTAGAGLLHKEYHEENFSKNGGAFEMVQLWVNLPQKHKLVTPHYQTLSAASMGRVSLPGNNGEITIIAGSYNGVKGPAQTYTPVDLWNIRLNSNGQCSLPTYAGYNTAMLVVHGDITINGQSIPEHSFVLFKNEGEVIDVQANQQSTILFMSGEPINEPIASYGPFVMNTQEEIMEAVDEMRNGRFGVLS